MKQKIFKLLKLAYVATATVLASMQLNSQDNSNIAQQIQANQPNRETTISTSYYFNNSKIVDLSIVDYLPEESCQLLSLNDSQSYLLPHEMSCPPGTYYVGEIEIIKKSDAVIDAELFAETKDDIRLEAREAVKDNMLTRRQQRGKIKNNQIIQPTINENLIDMELYSQMLAAQAQAIPTTGWNGVPLSKRAGSIMGPSGKETYYNLKMDRVVQIMHNMGFEGEYWIRADGAKMLGPYIMVAAHLGIRPKGTLVETSMGLGVVCDTGTFAIYNPTQIDIAVNW